jgi:hypothetical protein
MKLVDNIIIAAIKDNKNNSRQVTLDLEVYMYTSTILVRNMLLGSYELNRMRLIKELKIYDVFAGNVTAPFTNLSYYNFKATYYHRP